MYIELNAYYIRHGISALDFHCPYFSSCSRKYPNTFTTAKESFVSSGYVDHKLPRIVFISLDSGSAETDPTLKTLERVRMWEEENQNVLGLEKNKHWYRTHELAYTILRNFKDDMRLEEAKHYFAHVNSAKCCENKPFRAQASQTLFDNCRGFIAGELEILKPDIIVTQGKWARLAVDGHFPRIVAPDYFPESLTEVKIIEITTHPVLLIETFHPRHTSFHTHNRPHYSQYELIAREFMADNSPHRYVQKIEYKTSLSQNKYVDNKKSKIEIHLHKKENLMTNRSDYFVTGYQELSEYPEYPANKVPSQADCEGYTYISMVQLCNISEKYGQTRSKACNAFGGDKGKLPVAPERQAWVWGQGGYQVKKFVLVSAAKDYFREVGIHWA